MKKLLILFAVFSLVSCLKISENGDLSKPTRDQQIIFEISARHPDATKAVKSEWETGDVLFVFFSGKSAPAYLRMEWDGSKWQSTPKNGLSFMEGDMGTMRAVYLPFGSNYEIAAAGSSFIFSGTQYSYYMTSVDTYSVVENKLSGDFAMEIPEGYVQFFIENSSATASDVIELREPRLCTKFISSISADGSINESVSAWGAPITGYVYDKENKTAEDSKGYLFSGELRSSVRGVETDFLFTCVQGGYSGSYYTKTFAGKTLYKSENSGRAVKLPALSSWTSTTTHKPIDFGVDVNGKRIYWSRVNLGATEETAFGDYYAWGEIGKKTNFVWATYQYGASATTLTKYNTKAANGVVDNKVTLEAGDDVVSSKLGGFRRMPTKAEWEALKNNCVWTWKTPSDGYPCYGYIITGKGTYKDNQIYLPAAGVKNGTEYQEGLSPEDGFGGYWSSSLDIDSPGNAWRFGISGTARSSYSYYRSSGMTIRPVIE